MIDEVIELRKENNKSKGFFSPVRASLLMTISCGFEWGKWENINFEIKKPSGLKFVYNTTINTFTFI